MEPKLEAELTLFSDKPSCFSRANRVKDKKTKTERFVTKKVNCSLAFIQRLGHSAHNYKIAYNNRSKQRQGYMGQLFASLAHGSAAFPGKETGYESEAASYPDVSL